MKPGIRGARLPRVIGRIGKEKIPRIVGLDSQSSYAVGYDPATGGVSTSYLLTQDNSPILQEDGSFVLL